MSPLQLSISIVSHVFLNPALMLLLMAIGEGRFLVKRGTALVRMPVWAFVVYSTIIYTTIMALLFGALLLLNRTTGIDAFLQMQFGYWSYWRLPVVLLMAVHNAIWFHEMEMNVEGFIFFGPLLGCVVIQTILFVRHL